MIYMHWFNPSANFSFFTPFLANRFDVCPDILLEPILTYTLIDESVVTKRVYLNYPVLVFHKVIPCDLVKLDIVDFDVIVGIDWLHVSYTSIDYKTHRVKFQFLNEPIL